MRNYATGSKLSIFICTYKYRLIGISFMQLLTLEMFIFVREDDDDTNTGALCCNVVEMEKDIHFDRCYKT